MFLALTGALLNSDKKCAIVNEHADLAIFGDFEHFANDIFGTSSICSVSSVSSVSSFCSVSSGMGWDGIQVG